MTLIEAAKLAREALVLWKDESPYSWSQADENAVVALNKAIAEAEQQKPVAWKDKTYGNLHHQDFGDSIPLYTAPPKREFKEKNT